MLHPAQERRHTNPTPKVTIATAPRNILFLFPLSSSRFDFYPSALLFFLYFLFLFLFSFSISLSTSLFTSSLFSLCVLFLLFLFFIFYFYSYFYLYLLSLLSTFFSSL